MELYFNNMRFKIPTIILKRFLLLAFMWICLDCTAAESSRASLEIIQALEHQQYDEAAALLRAQGVSAAVTENVKSRLGQAPAPGQWKEPFVKAVLIGPLRSMTPETAQIRMRQAAAAGFDRVFWEIDAVTNGWEALYDAQLAGFQKPPIAVLNLKTNDAQFIDYFRWYERYASRLHSLVINADDLDNYVFKTEGQRREANRVMGGLWQLIKALRPESFVWMRVVWDELNSDRDWIRSMSFKPDGFLVWNIPDFNDPYDKAREKYLKAAGRDVPMVLGAFYGLYPETTQDQNTPVWGRLIHDNLDAYQRQLTAAGYCGLAPDWRLFHCLALKEQNPAYLEATNNANTSARFKWNLQTTVETYNRAGRKNPAWDLEARQAMELYARIRAYSIKTGSPIYREIAWRLLNAIRAGCDDPLVRYLHTRYVLPSVNNARPEVLFATTNAASAMEASGYSDFRKFFACLKAADAMRSVAPTNSPESPETARFYQLAEQSLIRSLRDQTIPDDDMYSACNQWLTSEKRSGKSFEYPYEVIAEPLFKYWPKAGWAYELKGAFYIQLAWNVRGSGWANTVPSEKWPVFHAHINEAKKALEKAWELDPTRLEVAIHMLTVALGLEKDDRFMQTWFERAMALDPDSYRACQAKRNYLEPKWHGSPEELIAFGRECVASEKWGGRVPLMLAEVHDTLAANLKSEAWQNYWLQPEVWTDLKSSYEKFFRLNPQSTGWHHNYARHAYRCQQWDELNRQIDLLGPVNYSFFGGKAAYEKMVQLARKNRR